MPSTLGRWVGPDAYLRGLAGAIKARSGDVRPQTVPPDLTIPTTTTGPLREGGPSSICERNREAADSTLTNFIRFLTDIDAALTLA
jgi:hypothetical protein